MVSWARARACACVRVRVWCACVRVTRRPCIVWGLRFHGGLVPFYVDACRVSRPAFAREHSVGSQLTNHSVPWPMAGAFQQWGVEGETFGEGVWQTNVPTITWNHPPVRTRAGRSVPESLRVRFIVQVSAMPSPKSNNRSQCVVPSHSSLRISPAWLRF